MTQQKKQNGPNFQNKAQQFAQQYTQQVPVIGKHRYVIDWTEVNTLDDMKTVLQIALQGIAFEQPNSPQEQDAFDRSPMRKYLMRQDRYVQKLRKMADQAAANEKANAHSADTPEE